MKATDAYRKINNSPIKGIVLYYTEQILKMDKINLGSVIAQIQTGKTPPKANPKYYSNSDVNWFKPSDIGYGKYLEVAGEKFSNIAITEKKATIYPKDTLLLIGIGGGVGRVSILKEEGSSNQQITGITFNEKVCAQYAYYYYLVREDYLKSQAKSMSFPILNQSRMKELEFRCPSVPEQNEFVKFIDACWYSFLNNEIPDISIFEISPELKEYALKQFKAIELDDKIQKNIENGLTLLSNLKQSILQEAIQGKLTADWRKQNPNTEPASEILNRIKSVKAQLIKDKKIKKEKALPSITEEEIPFELPAGWLWCRMQNYLDVRDGTHNTPKYVKSGIPLVTSKNLYTGELDLSNIKYISEQDHKEISKRSNVERDDILLAMIGSIGNPVIVDIEPNFSIKNVALIKYYLRDLSHPNYIKYFLETATQKFIKEARGGVQPFISLTKLRHTLFPIPPLKEQKVIVEKVETLMKQCQILEQEIKTSETNSKMLMQAVLKEAFEGKKEEVVKI